MNKRLLVGLTLSLGLAVVGTFIGMQEGTTSKESDAVTVNTELPTVQYGLSRYQIFENISEIKEAANTVVLADYVSPKRTYTQNDIVFTESVFKVEKVIKGEEGLNKTDIIINETGGVKDGKKYTSEGDELFDKGKYLLFLDKADQEENTPYDVFYVKGVAAGKFKLENGKVKGYGTDPVKNKASKLSESQFLQEVGNK
jgi:hypothetical protein